MFKLSIGENEHQSLGVMTQWVHISKWTRKIIIINFVIRLPQILDKFDTIWIIVEKLMNFMHFISIQNTYNSKILAKIYTQEIY